MQRCSGFFYNKVGPVDQFLKVFDIRKKRKLSESTFWTQIYCGRSWFRQTFWSDKIVDLQCRTCPLNCTEFRQRRLNVIDDVVDFIQRASAH